MFERRCVYGIHYIAWCVITFKIVLIIKINKIIFEVEQVYRYGCAIYVSVYEYKKIPNF